MDYRKYIYEYYVSRYTSFRYDVPAKLLENQRILYRKYFYHLLPKDKSAKVLDIGSGYGAFVYFLNKEGYKNVLGIDCSREQVELARKLGVENIFCADAVETLRKYTQEFNVITALEVIEHFNKEELFTLLASLANALKPGGIFIMRSPNAEALFASKYRYGDFTHEIAFTQTSIHQLLMGAGFKEIVVYPEMPFIYSIASFVRYIIWQFFRSVFILYLAAETGCFRGHIITQNFIVAARR